MIATLTGEIKSISLDRAIIEVGGVGLSINLTQNSATHLSLGTIVTFHTSLVVREESLTLYGFLTAESKHLFEQVQTVSGIGPKVALAILGSLSPDELAAAIATENISAIERVPGIGRKGAQRLILELKGKLSDLSEGTRITNHQPAWREQLTNALISLGFTPKDSDRAITKIVNELQADGLEPADLELSEMLKKALQSGGHK
ncbi:MAG: Holliday junction branch migration protein RuvA [Actinobacteria bacterium]|nr:Holliday junction branch migration protein RuvA [Actinomycetota bacterium]